MSRPRLARSVVIRWFFLAMTSGWSLAASAEVAGSSNLGDLTLEQLGNLTVTSVARRPERLADAAASVYVITQYDIAKSGARTLPEALRLAPNLEVSQVRANVYAVSARGFQNLVTNKLLVLIDGRAVYTSVLSGVEWDEVDVMMADVDRIEVISGPGAALWGANAVDGVINVVTKPSAQTQGGLVVLGAGSVSNDAQMRYGGRFDGGSYRVYAMHTYDDHSTDRDGNPIGDSYEKDQVGFRTDFGATDSMWHVSGDAYQGSEPHLVTGAIDLEGFNLTASHEMQLADGSGLQLQSYVNHTERVDPVGIHDFLSIVDLSLQDNLPAIGAHSVSFGGGYRLGDDRTTPNAVVRFDPENENLSWTNLFAQDEIALAPDLSLTAGLKLEKNVYTGWEWLPDLRLAYKFDPDQLVWTAVSRAVREPARVDRDFFFPGNAPFAIKGGPDFQSEVANIFEVGYKSQPTKGLSFSITGYVQDFPDLRSGQPAPGGGFYIVNQMAGTGSGIEAWAAWQVSEAWRLNFGLLELRQNLHRKAGSEDPTGPAALGNDPRHTVKVRSDWQLYSNLSVQVAFRYVSALSYLTTVPAYNATDITVVWRVAHDTELMLSGLDVFHPNHVEFDDSGDPAVIPRTVYGQIRWTF